MPPTEPGLIERLPFADYCAIEAVNHSSLKHLARSPAHFKAAAEKVDEADSKALRIGRAFHMASLEPHLFEECYVAKPEGIDRRTKEGKEAWALFELTAGHKEILAGDEYECATAMAGAVLMHPTARTVVNDAPGLVEASFVWRDPATGILCKGRADRTVTSQRLLVDLKSTEDASPGAFQRSAFKYGYHRQMAMYLDGLAAVGHPMEGALLVAVEKTPPYALAVYLLAEDAISFGRSEYRTLLGILKSCQESGDWPGYPEDVQALGLPEYAWM